MQKLPAQRRNMRSQNIIGILKMKFIFKQRHLPPAGIQSKIPHEHTRDDQRPGLQTILCP